MSFRGLVSCSMAALAGVSMLAVSLSPASAFTASGAFLEQSVQGSNINEIQWKRWGWGPAAVVGGVAAGAIIGSAIAGPRYYGPAYYDGPVNYGDYGPCWRRAVDPYGRWYWARTC
jgi:hypothetical protein